jgi:hypothetical protein
VSAHRLQLLAVAECWKMVAVSWKMVAVQMLHGRVQQ